jgi:predicted nuclease of predicted toxin-antitoxin system
MRWLLDQGIPRSCVKELTAAGHEAVHAADIGLERSADVVILERAAAENRVVVTLDADFHALLADSLAGKPSVIRIRDEGLKAPEVTAVVLSLFKRFADQLLGGCAMTLRNGRVRYRMLPLV